MVIVRRVCAIPASPQSGTVMMGFSAMVLSPAQPAAALLGLLLTALHST
jgi:hypothetical protein